MNSPWSFAGGFKTKMDLTAELNQFVHSININLSKNLGLVVPGMVITQLGALQGAFPAKTANYSGPEQEIRCCTGNVHAVFWGPRQVALFYATFLYCTQLSLDGLDNWKHSFLLTHIIYMKHNSDVPCKTKQNKHSAYLGGGRKRHRLKKQKYLQNISGDYFCICSACL